VWFQDTIVFSELKAGRLLLSVSLLEVKLSLLNKKLVHEDSQNSPKGLQRGLFFTA
jgi:hypothetical protein